MSESAYELGHFAKRYKRILLQRVLQKYAIVKHDNIVKKEELEDE